MKMVAKWYQFDYFGKGEFAPTDEPEIPLEFRETPKLYFVRLPSGTELRLRKFRRFDETKNTQWRHYYGSTERLSRSFIDFKLQEK